MKILHVSLGLPPFRTGGLNRYCADLMAEQARRGDTVGLLYPAEFTLTGKTKIKKTSHPIFDLYRVVNPLPVALSNGISDPGRYIKKCNDPKVYREFLEAYKPDIIHVHSLQGIHKEFFTAAGEAGIRMVFTTHDFYPFCPICILLHRDGSICDGTPEDSCAECNAGRGLSVKQEIVMQSRLYVKLKYSGIMKKIRASERKKTVERASIMENTVCSACDGEYAELKAYYMDILKLMNVIHCNSEGTGEIYRRLLPDADCRVVSITRLGIKKETHKRSEKVLRLGFVGGKTPYKGVDVLLDAAKILDEKNTEYELHLYGADFSEYASKNPRIKNGGFYTSDNEKDVWNSFDVLAVPSKCYETFSFVTLEALSHGLRVVCSDLVGARQLLPASDIFRHGSADELAKCILSDSVPVYISDDMLSMELHANLISRNIYFDGESVL